MLPPTQAAAASVCTVRTIRRISNIKFVVSFRSALKQLQVALQCLRSQLPSHLAHNGTMAVNKNGFRYARYAIADGSGAIGVHYIRVGDPMLLQKTQPVTLFILKIHTDKGNSMGLCLLPL